MTDLRIQIARDLREIRRLHSNLSVQVYYAATGRDVSDLDALNLLGPAARLEAWERVFDQAEADYFERLSRGECTEADRPMYAADQVDEYHPLAVLASWEDVVRDELGTPTQKKASVKAAAKYLGSSVTWMFDTNEYGDVNFIQVDEMVRDLARCRANLENVLKDGSRAEFTRVNCIADTCDTHPRLMKLWGAQVRWDRYRCPACRTEYDAQEFKMAKAQNMHSRGLERFIAPRDAADATEIPVKTVYSWMKRRKAERVWVTPPGGSPSASVWWPDIRDLARERRARLDRAAIRRAERKAEKEAEAAAKERDTAKAKAS